ncbi:MAG: GNAT family N-acetyltransferase [Desulfurococcales archaeon]|nr:GNAT family N-acetyltransferase [Desulfurococcales archaeon]
MSSAIQISKGLRVRGRVSRDPFRLMSRRGYKWFGIIPVKLPQGEVLLWSTGTVAQWFSKGEIVEVVLLDEPKQVGKTKILGPRDYELYRIWQGEPVKVWPPWRREYSLERRDALNLRRVYEYRVVAREAETEDDYIEIVNLEQHHYASKEEIVAVWRCPICGRYAESNVQPICPVDKVPMKLQEIRGSLPSSRFLILELASRKPFEPRIVGYVRIDTPIPLMNRRLPDGSVEKLIREKVFPKDWFHPTFWPLAGRKKLLAKYKELSELYGPVIARAMIGEEISRIALRRANTAAARIARVVVHPDYRGDGLGVLAVKAAIEWVRERRIPEMKRRKHVIETIAMMARYNPFFEKAGFYYMWDTASGRPVLMYPLTEEAKKYIEKFLREDPVARQHGGRLYKSRYGKVPPLPGLIKLIGVSKIYSSELDVSRLPPELQDVLRAFGVEKRLVEKYVLRDANLEVEPGETIVVVGASGAGKTTLLRMVLGGLRPDLAVGNEAYRPTDGKIEAPEGARIAALLPGEMEPVYGEETLLEHVARKIGDAAAAVEVLNMVGLSDAVFYRARFNELSTGQKERAKLASLFAEKPQVLVIDEFTAHLDSLTAVRVARKVGQLAKKSGITLIVATNRPEVIDALNPDKLVYVGYGTINVERKT